MEFSANYGVTRTETLKEITNKPNLLNDNMVKRLALSCSLVKSNINTVLNSGVGSVALGGSIRSGVLGIDVTGRWAEQNKNFTSIPTEACITLTSALK